ncbi:probable ATP-dependent RNA helicase CG8611 [Anopheles funestus]|uniref:probable ATP-dependent RNA helicase CG8611 n=1 Tax=Anopheles funestus TaxID=62324 RepID=UPI0020C6B177|nr:probable ATP-dependent RNA helicase CG8611 [Anopheles funestus]
MDLMLSNFIFDDPPQVITRQVEGTKTGAEKGEISIKFNKTQPAKVVVARKRGNIIKKTKDATLTEDEEIPPRDIYQPKGHPSNNKKLNDLTIEKKKQRTTSNTSCNGPGEDRNIEIVKPIQSKIQLPQLRPVVEKLFSDQSFANLAIHPHSKKNIADMLHFTQLTMVQNKAIPLLLDGNDALIRAQTGSGKTLAYALPVVESLHEIRPQINRSDGIRAVIIVPTRELAVQTYELLHTLLKPFNWIVPGYLTGGEKRKTEKARLRAGLNILIATPGRFCDHIRNTESLKLAHIRWLVLDEADRLLELGYEKDVKEIIDAIHNGQKDNSENELNKIQTVLLSATLTASVKELAGLTLKDPVFIETSEVFQNETSSSTITNCAGQLLNVAECVSIPGTVKQQYLIVAPKLRLATLSALIVNEHRKKPSKLLIFMATQDLVDFHYDVMIVVLTLQKFANYIENDSSVNEQDLSINVDNRSHFDNNVLLPGLKFYKLHGRMTQIERSSVFQSFRKSTAAVLICTDVAARGIDIPLVDLVVQYHAPQILADYVHRVGRTARAGESGRALLFIEPSETDFIKYLANKHIRIQEQNANGIIRHFGQLLNRDNKCNSMVQEHWAIELQHRYEQLIEKENVLFDSAKKAFLSWVRYYSNFPKELRNIFYIKAVHMGHYAKSLGLRDAPKNLLQFDNETKNRPAVKSPLNRPIIGKEKFQRRNLLQTKKGLLKRQNDVSRSIRHGCRNLEQSNSYSSTNLITFLNRSQVLNISEFDSGIGPSRKKMKK